MAYAAWSVSFGEQPSASKWNILGTNDASFNDGTGIGNSAIKYNNISSVGLVKGASSLSFSPITPAGPTDVTSSSVTFTPSVASYALIWFGGKIQINSGAYRDATVYLNIGGSNVANAVVGLGSVASTNYVNAAGFYFATLAASSQTIKLQAATSSAGNTALSDGYWRALIIAQ